MKLRKRPNEPAALAVYLLDLGLVCLLVHVINHILQKNLQLVLLLRWMTKRTQDHHEIIGFVIFGTWIYYTTSYYPIWLSRWNHAKPLKNAAHSNNSRKFDLPYSISATGVSFSWMLESKVHVPCQMALGQGEQLLWTQNLSTAKNNSQHQEKSPVILPM